ncbi:uncharacterized protein PG986_011164 [Apiospora aurea]|uniref:Uncharacterized protein n=1 Tax=Apiospora aurea TaxID=335848 RepID=A0ABR1Q4A4_9PEZI
MDIRPHVPRAELYCNLQNQDISAFPESALDFTIRILFAIATLPDSAIGGQLFRPRWKPEESIAELVDHVFPQRLLTEIAPDSGDSMDRLLVRPLATVRVGLVPKIPLLGRLYDLWLEAEDPTPITTVGKWSDSKKSGRYVYWAGFVATIIAIVFGIAATALGAVQVWISWCSWVDDPSRPGCSKS